MSKQLTRHTLKDQAKEAIRDFITQSRFSTDRRINVGYLSNRLGVSRTPICQALEELRDEGLVEHSANRGYFMVEMTPDMAVDLYLVRGVLEGLACKLAAQNASSEAIARIAEVAEGQRPLVDRGDVLSYSRTTFNFHTLVANSCGNRVLAEVLALIKNRTQPLHVDITPIFRDLHQDHLDLVDALTRRDSDRAAKIAVGHCDRMQQLIIDCGQLDEQAASRLKRKTFGQGVPGVLDMTRTPAPAETDGESPQAADTTSLSAV